MKIKDSKLIKYTNVVDSILKQMAIKDLNTITITSIAKSSQVSRGWLYKYLGHNIEQVLTTCLKHFLEHFAQNLERCLNLDPTTAKIKAQMLHFARMGLIFSYIYNKELYQNQENRNFFHQELNSYITQALGTM